MSKKLISFLFFTMLLMFCSALNLKKLISDSDEKDISSELLETQKCNGNYLKSRKDCADGTTRCCFSANEKCDYYNGSYQCVVKTIF